MWQGGNGRIKLLLFEEHPNRCVCLTPPCLQDRLSFPALTRSEDSIGWALQSWLSLCRLLYSFLSPVTSICRPFVPLPSHCAAVPVHSCYGWPQSMMPLLTTSGYGPFLTPPGMSTSSHRPTMRSEYVRMLVNIVTYSLIFERHLLPAVGINSLKKSKN